MSQISVYSNYGEAFNQSIPIEVVEQLDQYDFGKKVICREAIEIINENFDVVIMVTINSYYSQYLCSAISM